MKSHKWFPILIGLALVGMAARKHHMLGHAGHGPHGPFAHRVPSFFEEWHRRAHEGDKESAVL